MNERPAITCRIDDKHVPLYNILWIAETPHFCGDEECTAEGLYEIRLALGESLYGSRRDRDGAVSALQQWRGGDETEW
ncbi:MAG: hypothetical protein ABGX22_25190 [Pirellulaceae bacterium]